MNTLESYLVENPQNVTDTCAKLMIDDVTMPFILNDITTINEQYTLSFWVKSDEAGTIQIYDGELASTTEWLKYVLTFTANNTKLNICFTTTGTYYIYHPKLEVGSKATDWTPAPEDMVDVNTFDEYKEQVSAELAVTADEVTISITTTINQEISSVESKIAEGDNNLQEQLTEFRMNYDFTDDGQYIGRSDSNTKLHLDNDTMEILVAGNAVTVVDTDGFSADRLNANEINLGDYTICVSNGRLRIS